MATILHIDEEKGSRDEVRRLLRDAGHAVIEASTGLEGLRAARRRPPHLVLVDLRLSDLDGNEVTLRLRGMPQMEQVPIVVTTTEDDREMALAMGAAGFIPKPFDEEGFASQVLRFLRGHREVGSARASQQLRIAGQRIVGRLEKKVVELSEANERLEELIRLRQEFLRNLTHEFATPLTPVVGYLGLLLGEDLGPLTPMQRKGLTAIEQSTQKLRELVDTLVEVSSFESGRIRFAHRSYDFARVAAAALDIARPRFEAREIELHVEPAPLGLHATGDPDLLRRAMVHVLDNAAKFSPREGLVAVEIDRRCESEVAYLSLRVGDDGPGIEAEQRERVFEPFYQVDGSITRAHGGVGLGLAFAAKVAQTFGGSVEIRSPPTEQIAGCALTGTEILLRVREAPAVPT